MIKYNKYPEICPTNIIFKQIDDYNSSVETDENELKDFIERNEKNLPAKILLSNNLIISLDTVDRLLSLNDKLNRMREFVSVLLRSVVGTLLYYKFQVEKSDLLPWSLLALVRILNQVNHNFHFLW